MNVLIVRLVHGGIGIRLGQLNVQIIAMEVVMHVSVLQEMIVILVHQAIICNQVLHLHVILHALMVILQIHLL